jgi:hypothetical protein
MRLRHFEECVRTILVHSVQFAMDFDLSTVRPRPIGASSQATEVAKRGIPPQFLFGSALLSCAWVLAWFGDPPLSEHTFFAIWLGYVLSVDGIVYWRSGTSLLTRSRRNFAGLFLASIPLWWLFEAANSFVGNWHYLEPHKTGFFISHLEASFDFSTVIPAIFVTAEFYATTWLGRRRWQFARIDVSRRGLKFISIGGIALFVLSLVEPRYLFPFVWIGVFFALDPINALCGQQSIAKQVARNRWNTVVVLFAAGITCGFFWEMWNYWSMPKWVYEISFAARWHIFEMPALGYGGYLPFALEVYAIYHFILLIVGKREHDFLRFDD